MPTIIPMLDLKIQQDSIHDQLYDTINRIISDTKYVQDYFDEKPANTFEAALSAYTGKSYAIGVGSGTAALHLAMLASGLSHGDEVITVPNTFVATVEPIIMCGAKPVFIDIRPDTLLMNTDLLKDLISPRTKMIVPVHLFGNPCDVKAITEVLEQLGRSDICVIEDCAHAIGSAFNRRLVPIGSTGAFSFNPGKNIGALGDGGAIVTDDVLIARKARLLSNHGRIEKGNHQCIGFNSRLSTLNAAVLELKLKYVNLWNSRRQDIAAQYREGLLGVDEFTPFQESSNSSCVYHQFAAKAHDRDGLMHYLKNNGISTAIHYPILIPDQPFFLKNGLKKKNIPVASVINQALISIPCYPECEISDVNYIIAAIKKFYCKLK